MNGGKQSGAAGRRPCKRSRRTRALAIGAAVGVAVSLVATATGAQARAQEPTIRLTEALTMLPGFERGGAIVFSGSRLEAGATSRVVIVYRNTDLAGSTALRLDSVTANFHTETLHFRGAAAEDPDRYAGDVTCDDTAATTAAGAVLAPGAAVTCTSDEFVVPAEPERGQWGGVHRVGTALYSNQWVSTFPSPAGDLDIETGNGAVRGDTTEPTVLVAAGDAIHYTFDATNTGFADLKLSVADELGLTYDCESAILEPNETRTCTSTEYVVTEDDFAAGEVTNAATVHGTDELGLVVGADEPLPPVAVVEAEAPRPTDPEPPTPTPGVTSDPSPSVTDPGGAITQPPGGSGAASLTDPPPLAQSGASVLALAGVALTMNLAGFLVLRRARATRG